VEFREPDNKAEYQDAEAEKVTKKVITGFKVTYVFDITDTDGSDEQLPVLVKGLTGNTKRERQIYESLKAYISTEHPVQEVTGTASKGSFNLSTGVISVRADVEYLQKVKTLLHEYAHSVDFAMNPSVDISRNRRELVAESVAFTVSLRLGLDASRYSMGYIKSWLKDKDELKAVVDTVQKVAAKIIDNLAGFGDAAFAALSDASPVTKALSLRQSYHPRCK